MKRLFVVLVIALSGCGGGTTADTASSEATDPPTAGVTDATDAPLEEPDDVSSDPTSAPETATTPAPTGNGGGGETPEVTEMGTFSVNDTEFAVNYLNRCIPFGGEDGQTIDLQPLAQGQGAQMNLYGTADSLNVSVQGSSIEDMFGSIAFAADPYDDGEIHESAIDGDRWTGSATLLDSLGGGGTVELTWDVMIPGETIDCSL